MRPLDEVIDAVLKLVPADFDQREVLVAELESIQESYPYTAPESVGDLWFRFATTLNVTLGDPDSKWKEEIADVMSGKKDYLEVLNA